MDCGSRLSAHSRRAGNETSRGGEHRTGPYVVLGSCVARSTGTGCLRLSDFITEGALPRRLVAYDLLDNCLRAWMCRDDTTNARGRLVCGAQTTGNDRIVIAGRNMIGGLPKGQDMDGIG